MNELSIRLKRAASKISEESAKKWLRANKVISSLAAVAYLVVGYFDNANRKIVQGELENQRN